MKQELYEILDERARLRVARFPLALGLSLGLHLALIAIFLWGAGAGSPPPKVQLPKQEEPIAPSAADGAGMEGTQGLPGTEAPPTARLPILAGARSLRSSRPALAIGISPVADASRRPKPLSWPRHRRPRTGALCLPAYRRTWNRNP